MLVLCAKTAHQFTYVGLGISLLIFFGCICTMSQNYFFIPIELLPWQFENKVSNAFWKTWENCDSIHCIHSWAWWIFLVLFWKHLLDYVHIPCYHQSVPAFVSASEHCSGEWLPTLSEGSDESFGVSTSTVAATASSLVILDESLEQTYNRHAQTLEYQCHQHHYC